MPNKDNKSKEEKGIDIIENWGSSRLTVFLLSTSYTIAIIAMLGGIGYYLDKEFGTKPTFFIAGLVIAFPLTQVMLYKKVKKYSQNTINKEK